MTDPVTLRDYCRHREDDAYTSAEGAISRAEIREIYRGQWERDWIRTLWQYVHDRRGILPPRVRASLSRILPAEQLGRFSRYHVSNGGVALFPAKSVKRT